MLGSVLMCRSNFYGTTRRLDSSDKRILPNIDVTRLYDLYKALDWAGPDVVINCAGIVKSECDRHDPERVVAVNSRAPRTLAKLAADEECRVIHVSTDCVFDGSRGGRTESDSPDATDLYGHSKNLGELREYSHCVTLRTSFIGRDRVHGRGLLEWLLKQEGDVPGYARSMWSGLSTHELARVIRQTALRNHPPLSGLYHVAGPVISKAALLVILAKAYGLACRIQPENEPCTDRTLDGFKFAQVTGYEPPTWTAMAEELVREEQ